jgi:pyruvate/2-oxoglutarate dehydrogenase complex dihydrolipoamide dehydrogenase (E3) component
MKVIVCANTNKVLGVHMCGEDAPEIIQVCVFLTAKKRFVFFLSFQASDS